MIILYY